MDLTPRGELVARFDNNYGIRAWPQLGQVNMWELDILRYNGIGSQIIDARKAAADTRYLSGLSYDELMQWARRVRAMAWTGALPARRQRRKGRVRRAKFKGEHGDLYVVLPPEPALSGKDKAP